MTDNNPLGKQVKYPEHYDPQVLVPIARSENRSLLGLSGQTLPFHGMDTWTIYELSWLDQRGKPQVGILRMVVPCTSSHLVESKSLKLYLGSFNQERFSDEQALLKVIRADLGKVLGEAPALQIDSLDKDQPGFTQPQGICLDALPVDIEHYHPEPALLEAEGKGVVEERLYSHLFRSNCPITDQPDWATIVVDYAGPAISHEGLLKYLVSYRQHNDFHENCVERIFLDILRRCAPRQLTVQANFTRRGGIDINPFRSTEKINTQRDFPRYVRQ